MRRAGVLSRFACRAILALMAAAATVSHAAGPARNAPAPETRWGDAAAYKLKAAGRGPILDQAARSRTFEHSLVTADYRPTRGGTGKDQAGSNWSPRIAQGAGRSASPRRLARAPFDLETLPVTVLGRRFVFSRFTMNRKGVRGMVSTDF